MQHRNMPIIPVLDLFAYFFIHSFEHILNKMWITFFHVFEWRFSQFSPTILDLIHSFPLFYPQLWISTDVPLTLQQEKWLMFLFSVTILISFVF